MKLKKAFLISAATAMLFATGTLIASTGSVSARVVCNAEGDCWHTDAVPPRAPGVTFSVHPDDWYFHQQWTGSDRHYRDYHEGRGYYKGGVWVTP